MAGHRYVTHTRFDHETLETPHLPVLGASRRTHGRGRTRADLAIVLIAWIVGISLGLAL